MQVKQLEWDSNFFGLPIARIIAENPTNSDLEATLQQLKTEGIKLVYLFLSNPMSIPPSIGTTVNVGGKVLYYKKLEELSDYLPQVSSYPMGIVDDKLYDLSLQSGVYSRFKLDEKLPVDAYERLYRAWIENSVQRQIADEVLVYLFENQIAGMVTLGQKGGWGDIGLIAVDNAFRGQKIGHHLLNAAYTYFYNLGVKELGVETQTNNEGACRFYEANGFEVAKLEYLYHVWL